MPNFFVNTMFNKHFTKLAPITIHAAWAERLIPCKTPIDNTITDVKYELPIITANILLPFASVNNPTFNGTANAINHIVNGAVSTCISEFVFWTVIFAKFISFFASADVNNGINGNTIALAKTTINCVNAEPRLYIPNCD